MGSNFAQAVRAAARRPFEERRQRERELARAGAAELDTIAGLLTDDDVRVRRTVVEVLRLVGRDTPRALEMLCERFAREPDVKARRRIASALGESGDAGHCAFLLDALERESHRFVQASLILALGSLRLSDWPDSWRARAGEAGPVGDALRKALANAQAPETNGQQALPRPTGSYLLRCYPGAEPLSQLELERRGLEATVTTPGMLRLEATGAELEPLSQLRSIRDDYHLVAEADAHGADEVAGACRRIDALLGGAGELRFRLGMAGVPRLQRRKLLPKLARRVEHELGWINATSSYELNLEVFRLGARFGLAWHAASWPQVRRPERETVAASIHPSVAAGLALLAREGKPADAAPTVLDPCCGSGTILAEHAALFPSARCIGIDIASDAVAMARANLAPLGKRCRVTRGNMRRLPLDDASVDVAIANLPFGIRTRSEAVSPALYADAARELHRVVSPGGTVVTYIANLRMFRNAFERAGWKPGTPTCAVDAGGLTVHVVRMQRGYP